MVEIKFEVCEGKITKVIVEDYEFIANAPIKSIGEIEELFKKLNELGVNFSRKEDIEEEKKIKEFIKSLSARQKCILIQFKGKNAVKIDELKNKCGDLRGPLAGLTRKAQSLGLIEKDKVALEPDWENRVYRLNPKLKKVVDFL